MKRTRKETMKKSKFLAASMLGVTLALALVTGCSGKQKGVADDAGKTTKLTYYSTSAEVNSMFEEMFLRYHEINPGIIIELIPTGVGQGQQEQLQSLYASGNAPTFMNIDPANVLDYQDKLLVFDDNTPWFRYLAAGAVDAGKFDGKIYGVPFSTQGYALNYNKRVVETVIPGFDPGSINTRNGLEAFFETLDAAGVSPTMLHGANWSLGAHYLGLVYAVHSPETEGGKAFIEGLMAGTIDIAQDKIFQGYMDTFDLLVKYNYNKEDPLVGNIDIDDQAFAQGKSASFFMGDWAWTIIGQLENKDNDFGFIPVPWSNDPNDYGNSQVVVTMPKVMCIDASQNTQEQQKAALDMLEWMLTTPEGQEYFIGAGFSMPYTNTREAEYNSMTASISGYMEAGKNINVGCFVYLSGDAWARTGDLMLKYMVGGIDRAELARGINAYWQTVGK
jgi:raffinose/stachyose/melibiose transport system substrate-binding protein